MLHTRMNEGQYLYKKYKLSFLYRKVKMVVWERVGRELLWLKISLQICTGWDTYPENLASLCFFYWRFIQNIHLNLGDTAPSCTLNNMIYLLCWLLTDHWVQKLLSLYIFPDTHTFLPMQFTWHFHCPLLTFRHSFTSCFLISILPSLSKVNM